jgi:hypothetical protein
MFYSFELTFCNLWFQAGAVGGRIVWILNEVTDISTSQLLLLFPGSFLYFRSLFGDTRFKDMLLIINVENGSNGAIKFEHFLTMEFPRSKRDEKDITNV